MNMNYNKDPKFTRNLIFSILELLCCFPICGILSLVFSLNANDAYKRGDNNEYNKFSKYLNISLTVGMIIGILISILFVFVFTFVIGGIAINTGNTSSEIIGKEYTLNDGSYIILHDNMEFEWYQSEYELDDNYYIGTYNVYTEDNALKYLTDLDYGITEEEMNDYFNRNKDSEIYNLDNLTVLTLNSEDMIYNGESRKDMLMKYKCYYGFYYDGIFDSARVDNGDHCIFTEK